MSIIVTHITQYGIIHASDSNLSYHGQAAGQAPKLFPIKRLDSALTVAGAYSVGKESMDTWMLKFIQHNKSSDLSMFVKTLTDSLNQESNQTEKKSGYDLHIAGYASVSGSSHPEFYHITNYSIDPNTGDYSVQNLSLKFCEDFWNKFSSVPAKQIFTNSMGYIYCNGFPSGRIVYFKLLQQMAIFRSKVWAEPNWRFRQPTSVYEEADYLRHDMELIKLFFKHSTYSAPYIGGNIQIYTIKCP
ncbi:MAG: hypothetical protein FVQ84_09925 [Planctomycetes bacterium]|nr:hypothetical protein [Planctomycetota bacterium]